MNDNNAIALTRYGYIRRNLPNVFNSDGFGYHYVELAELVNENQHTIPYKYDTYKKKFATRQYTIINPYNYILLVKTLMNNWDEITRTLNTSRLSLTPIVFDPDSDSRAIQQILKNEFRDAVFKKSVGRKVLLTTDIVEHYDSIYTHAIAWALHDKNTVKQMMAARFTGTSTEKRRATEAYSNLAGNILDRVVRDCDEQQTYGIPTGPETSRIISEIILSAADAEFVEQLELNRIPFTGGRYVDDYELYFNSKQHSEIALSILRNVLSKYRMKIGEQKTKILTNPPIPTDDDAVQQFSRIIPLGFGDTEDPYSISEDEISFEKIQQFIKDSVNLARKHDDPKLIRLALNKLRLYDCPQDSREIYQVYLLQLLANYPNISKYIFDIINHISIEETYNLEKILKTLCTEKSSSIYDLIWMLYGHIVFKITLSEKELDHLMSVNDPLIYLMLLHAQAIDLVALDMNAMQEKWDSYSLYDEGWMFKYESVRHGWLGSYETISDNILFNRMFDLGISFYETSEEEYSITEDDWLWNYETAPTDDFPIEVGEFYF